MFSYNMRLYIARFLTFVLVIAQVLIPLGKPLQTARAANTPFLSQALPTNGGNTPTPTFTPTPTTEVATPTPVTTVAATLTYTPTTSPSPTPTPTTAISPTPVLTASPTPSPSATPSSSSGSRPVYEATLPSGGGRVPIGNTPLTLLVAADAFGEPAEAHLQILQGEEAWSLAPHTGAAVHLAFVRAGTQEMVAPAPGKVTLQFSYRDLTLPHRYGGEFLKRLRFYEVLPGDTEPAFRLLPTHHRWGERLLSTVLGDNAPADNTTAPTAHVYIVESGPGGSDGDYSATSLTNQKDYQVSLFTGSASTSYTIPVPPAAAGPVPQLRLTYDSGRVDGMSSEKNNQPGWVGTGWELEIGAITRRMVPCGTEAPDLCLTSHYILTLNGVSSPLIPDNQTPHLYHLQDDAHWQVWQRFSDNPEHPDHRGEYWEVVTPDGTRYRFGGEFEPNTGADQQSVFYTPVHDNTECGAESGHVCLQKGYRWNLDYVVDPNGNAISLFYTREFNYYQSRRGRLPYVKAGYLRRIEYTKRQNGAYQPKAKIVFYTAPRCTGDCRWPDDFPDVPTDLACQDHGSCNQAVPTFWGTKRLDHIVTYVYDPTAGGPDAPWVSINRFQFQFAFSDPQGEDEGRKLILTGIVRSAPGASLSLPPVHYEYVLLPNRVIRNNDDSPMPMPRLHTITTELGGQVVFDYSQPQTCPGSRNDVHESRYCYFTYDPGEERRWYGWWRYVVTQMTIRSGYGQPEQVFHYTYEHPMWHHQDPPRLLRRSMYQLWNDFRGHRRVTVTDGAGHSTTYIFYQGMNGDLDPSGTPWESTITLDQDPCGLGAERPDDPGLQGRIVAIEHPNLDLTQRAYIQTVTASSDDYGTGNFGYDEPLIARFTAPATECHVVWAPSANAACPASEDTSLTTRVDYVYDAYGNRIQERYAGDVSTPDDDHILVRSFVYNPQAYIVNRVAAEGVYPGLQPPGSLTPSGALSFQQFAYDGRGIGEAPIHGNLTLRRRYISPTQTSDTRYAYDEWGRVIRVTDPNGAVTVTHYNPQYGYKDQVTDPLGHTVTYTYATANNMAWGVPSAITDPNGYTTTLQYDGFGRLTAVWLPTEPVEGTPTKAFAYHPDARPAYVETRQWVGETDGDEANAFLVSRAYYDGLGRELQRRASIDLTGEHGPRYSVVSRAYDATGHLARQSQPYPGDALDYTPPSWPQLEGYTAYTYDALGRVTGNQTYAQGALAFQTSTAYCGRLTRFTDANGHVKDQITDAFGNLNEVREHNQGATYTTTYTHDPLGRLTEIVDAAGNTITVQYDMLGRKVQMNDPDLGTWLYTYDPAGRLIAQRDGRGQWLYFTYDALGRMVTKRKGAPDGTLLAAYTYDPPGHVGALAERTAYTDHGEAVVTVRNEAFDARGRVLAQTWTFHNQGEKVFRLGFQYNAADDLLAVTYPGGTHGETGEQVHYSYIAHRVNRMWEGEYPSPTHIQMGKYTTPGEEPPHHRRPTIYIQNSEYNAAGQTLRREMTLQTSTAEAITQQWEYEAGTLRLSHSQVLPANSESLPLLDNQYQYDPAGNLVRLHDAVLTSEDGLTVGQYQCFTYDDLRRLVHAFTGNAACDERNVNSHGAYEVTYAYDAVGNLVSRNAWTYTYDANHPHTVAEVTHEDGKRDAYTYDANGNMVTRQLADGREVSLSYDAQNRLSAAQVVTPDGEEQSLLYRYDDQGTLVERMDSQTATFYIGPYYEYSEPRNAQGTVPANKVHTKHYYLVDGRPVAMRKDGALYYLFGDHLGSTSLVVSAATGEVVAQQRYLPFGSVRWRAGTLPTDRQYTGQRWDADLGLYDYKARYYAPALGRFIQPDTIVPEPGNPQALNRYAYVLNNPLRYNDPSGHRLSECGWEGGECVGEEPPPPSLPPFRYPVNVPPTPTPSLFPSIVPPALPEPIAPTVQENQPQFRPAPPEDPFQQESREEAEGLHLWIQLMSTGKAFLDALKYGKGSAARAVNPFPWLDFALGAAEQFFDDERKPNSLTFGQRFFRPLVKGSESWVTGIASDAAGGFAAGLGVVEGEATEPVGGGVAGLPLGAIVYLGVSWKLDEAFWPRFNEEHLRFLGEWK